MEEYLQRNRKTNDFKVNYRILISIAKINRLRALVFIATLLTKKYAGYLIKNQISHCKDTKENILVLVKNSLDLKNIT